MRRLILLPLALIALPVVWLVKRFIRWVEYRRLGLPLVDQLRRRGL